MSCTAISDQEMREDLGAGWGRKSENQTRQAPMGVA